MLKKLFQVSVKYARLKLEVISRAKFLLKNKKTTNMQGTLLIY